MFISIWQRNKLCYPWYSIKLVRQSTNWSSNEIRLFSLSSIPKIEVSDFYFTIKTYPFILQQFLCNIIPFFCLITKSSFGVYSKLDNNSSIHCLIRFVVLSGISWLILKEVHWHSKYKFLMHILLLMQLVSRIWFYFSVEWSCGYIIRISIISFTYEGRYIYFISVIYCKYTWLQ